MMNNQGDLSLNFDFSQIDPNFSGGGFLPVSDEKGWLVVLTGSNGWKPARSGDGYYLELVGIGQEPAVANKEFYLRLNLQHTKPSAQMAAAAQLSALGHVLGLPGRIGMVSELFNKPFRVVSVKQDNSEYTELARNGIRDVNGNPPGKGGSGPQMATPAPQIPQQGQQPNGFPQQQQPFGAPGQGQQPFPQQQPQQQPTGPVGSVGFGPNGSFQQSQQDIQQGQQTNPFGGGQQPFGSGQPQPFGAPGGDQPSWAR